tara:strand:- start:301 stop:2811 length:2511 start_codon:yes stop_codon:yes gene_type:complete
MTTYFASADNDGLIFTKEQNGTILPVTRRDWTTFSNQMTGAEISNSGPQGLNDFKTSQTQFNYFDSIKDGTPGGLQNNLNIYDGMRVGGIDKKAHDNSLRGQWNPTGSHIKHMRNMFSGKYKANIEYTTWLKLKNSDNYLDPPKKYDYHFWDAGMTKDRILINNNGTTPSIELASIATLIDPAAGKTESNILTTKTLFPDVGDTIIFDQSFMNAIGFKGNSYITATSEGPTQSGVPFSYRMNVGCGNACNGVDTCRIRNTLNHGISADHLSRYTIGNDKKKAQINSMGTTPRNTKDKIKLIVLKEWGDKMQVMSHFMNCMLNGGMQNSTLLTNDFPVFCLCLNLQIPCIFTGVTEKKVNGNWKPTLPDFKRGSDNNEPVKKRAYGILEYIPGDPTVTLYKKILQIRDEIHRENNVFLEGLNDIKSTNKSIKLGGQNVTLPEQYWNIMIADVEEIIRRNIESYGGSGTRPNNDNYTGKWWEAVCPILNAHLPVDATLLSDAVNNFIRTMKTQAYIKRVVKNVKYTARGGRGTRDSLKLMLFKSYNGLRTTASDSYSFGFSQDGQTFHHKKNFCEWGINISRNPNLFGGGMMGGMMHSGNNEAKMPTFSWRLFPGDFSQSVMHVEGENDEPYFQAPSQQWGQDIQQQPPLNYLNLRQQLFNNFVIPLYEQRWADSDRIRENDKYDGFVATIYSQYCYESWIEGQAAIEFISHSKTILELMRKVECTESDIGRKVAEKLQSKIQEEELENKIGKGAFKLALDDFIQKEESKRSGRRVPNDFRKKGKSKNSKRAWGEKKNGRSRSRRRGGRKKKTLRRTKRRRKRRKRRNKTTRKRRKKC